MSALPVCAAPLDAAFGVVFGWRVLVALLGGAALQRCDEFHIIAGFSPWGAPEGRPDPRYAEL